MLALIISVASSLELIQFYSRFGSCLRIHRIWSQIEARCKGIWTQYPCCQDSLRGQREPLPNPASQVSFILLQLSCGLRKRGIPGLPRPLAETPACSTALLPSWVRCLGKILLIQRTRDSMKRSVPAESHSHPPSFPPPHPRPFSLCLHRMPPALTHPPGFAPVGSNGQGFQFNNKHALL